MKKVKMCIICSIIIFTIFSLKNVVFAFDIFIDNFTGFSPARKLDNSDISFIEMLNREQEEWAVYTSGGGGYYELKNEGDIIKLGVNGAGDLTFVNSLVNFTVRDKVIYKIKAKILTPANDIVIEPICMFYDGSHYIHLHANKNAHFNKKNVFYADYNNMSGDVFIGLNYELLLDSSWHIFEARVGNNKVFFYIDGKEIGYFVSGKERRKGVNLPDKPLRPAVVIYSPGDIAEMYVDWIKIEME